MRYQIQTGFVYKFKFKLLLSSYDGIYKMLSSLTVEELRDREVDLFKETFEPLEISSVDYDNEFHIFYEIENSDILKLQDVNDISKTIYIPEYYIQLVPSINIKPYQKLGLSVNLGVFEDKDELEIIKNEINDIIANKVGISNNTLVFSYEEKWLSDDEFSVIKQEREANISDLSTIYSDNVGLLEQVSNLQGIINAYEEIIQLMT